MPANSKEYQKAYTRKRMKDPKFRAENQKRKRDRYHYQKKNGPIPADKELDHTNGVGNNKVRVISRKLNRKRGMNVANKKMGRKYSKKLI